MLSFVCIIYYRHISMQSVQNIGLRDLCEDNKVFLDHKPWYYDYLHSIRMNYESKTFDVLIGGGQVIEHSYKGTFTDDGEKLTLKFETEEDVYGNKDDNPIEEGPVVIESKYKVTEDNKSCFNGYSMQTAKYKVTFNRDPLFYGDRKNTLFNMFDGETIHNETNIFYSHLTHTECDTCLERAIYRSINDSKEIDEIIKDSNYVGFNPPEWVPLEENRVRETLNKLKGIFEKDIQRCSLIFCSDDRYIFIVDFKIIDITTNETKIYSSNDDMGPSYLAKTIEKFTRSDITVLLFS